MRPRIHAIAMPSEIGEFATEVRQIFIELGRAFGSESAAGECAPALDVYETDDALEITVDLPGVDAAAVRIVGKGDSVLVAGEKAARRARRDSSFHLVERGYGRFARAVRVTAAFDGARATAHLADGELRIVLPRLHERRGTTRTIEVSTGAPSNGPL